MAYVLKDRVLSATTTTGTGTVTVGSTVAGHQGVAAVGDGNSGTFCEYEVDANGAPDGAWEIFIGTYTASGTTLTRDYVLASSNSGAAVNFPAGDKYVALVSDASVALPPLSICEGRLTLTRHPDGCLLLYPRTVCESVRERIDALPIGESGWMRFFLGNATDLEMDGTGRVLIAPELRQAAGLGKEVVLLGMGAHFEVWDAVMLTAKESEAIAGGMPESLSGISI
jgi:MraZ protein